MKIKLATYEDIDTVMKLRAELLQHEESINPVATRGLSSPRNHFAYTMVVGRNLLDPGSVTLIAYSDDDSVAGFISLLPSAIIGEHSDTTATCNGFYVRPKYRGTMIPYRLWSAAQNTCSLSGKTQIQNIILEGNNGMTSLAMRWGFRPIANVFEWEIEDGK
jgi:GNAT superfamily N-acetyltransferase